MISQPAPFYDTTTKAEVAWITALDGVRLRVAFWASPLAAGALGSVLILPGRTEYLEKYVTLAGHLTGLGYHVASLDWRGQGLSGRLHPDPAIGHVAAFSDYQHDLAALEAWAGARASGAWALVAHSMGGLIGLRALLRAAPRYQAVVFTAPMWGITLPMWRRPTAAVLTRVQRPLAMDLNYAPGQKPRSYVLAAEYAGNALTSDAGAYQALQRILRARPELATGGASLGWVRRALREARAMARVPSPPVPALTFLGRAERVVTPRAIAARMARWPEGRLVVLDGARHDVWHEAPLVRAQLYEELGAHLAAHLGARSDG